MSYNLFPIRTVDQQFSSDILDKVTERFWKYLSVTSTINGTITPLRTTHYLDIMNQSIDMSYREPYFILADVSDYADYQYNIKSYYSKEAKISYDGNSIRRRITLVPQPPVPSYYLSNDYLDSNIRLDIKTKEGYNSGTYTILSINPDRSILTNEFFYNTESVSSQDGIEALLYDSRQGNVFTNPKIISGRGTIVINLDYENVNEITYKVSITTLPAFINWAYYIMRYLTTGSYNEIENVTR
ncbi:MAG: hypothetical protein ACOCV1_02380 [Bacillota bacterium]